MAVASLPSLSLRLRPATTSHCHLTAIQPRPEIWLRGPQKRAATIQFQGRKGTQRPLCFGASNGPKEPHPGMHPIPLLHPLSDLVRDFYSSINDKDMRKLDGLIDDCCIFEDLAFPKPFQGKEVHKFLEKLSDAMGKHVRFSIEGIYEGGETFVGVMWHLEWNKEPIPFSKGCSFYECSKNGEKLCIKRARVFVESPVKPGDIVMEVLKVLSLFFDKFPKLAENFKKPNFTFRFIMKAYKIFVKIFVEPFILPLLVYYTHFWTFGVRILSYVLIIVEKLLKFFM